MNITEERLAQIQDRLNAVEYPDHEHLTICGREGTKVVWVEQSFADGSVTAGGPVAEVDAGPRTAQMFLNAPQDLADLIAEIHRLRAELAKVREVTEETVERSARAAYGPKAWDKLDLRDPMTAVQRSAFMAQIRTALVSAAGGDDA